MKTDVVSCHHWMKKKNSHLLGTILVPWCGVLLMLVVVMNMSCMGILTPKYCFSIDEKLVVLSCACLKLYLYLIWNAIWYVHRKMVIHIIFFIIWTWIYPMILRRLAITHGIRMIDVSLIWWVTQDEKILITWCHSLLSSPFI